MHIIKNKLSIHPSIVDITLCLSAGACNKSARCGGRIGTQLLGLESKQKARVHQTKGVQSDCNSRRTSERTETLEGSFERRCRDVRNALETTRIGWETTEIRAPKEGEKRILADTAAKTETPVAHWLTTTEELMGR